MLWAFIGSLNKAVMVVAMLAPADPLPGVTDVTVGGVVLLAGINTTSTQ
jgi:hypothetical protein